MACRKGSRDCGDAYSVRGEGVRSGGVRGRAYSVRGEGVRSGGVRGRGVMGWRNMWCFISSAFHCFLFQESCRKDLGEGGRERKREREREGERRN